MSNINKLKLYDTLYDIEDTEARENIETLQNTVNNLSEVASTGDYNDLLNKPEHLGHTIKNTSTTFQDRGSLKFTGNVTVTDDENNDQTTIEILGGGSGGGGGHTIKDAEGNSMQQRDVLEFDGYLKTSDDETNQKTVVTDSPTQVLWEDWQIMSDEQKRGTKWIITGAPDNNVNASTVAIGTMEIFAGEVIPPGYLLCDGSAVSRTKYSELFEAIGTIWGAGDGSTTFNLPDLREVAPVGIGESIRTEENHDVFGLGEFKDDQLQTHTHSIMSPGVNGNAQWIVSTAANNPEHNATTDGPNRTTARIGTVTRGKRIGVNYIIKAKQVLIPVDIRDELNDVENEVNNLNDTVSNLIIPFPDVSNSAGYLQRAYVNANGTDTFIAETDGVLLGNYNVWGGSTGQVTVGAINIVSLLNNSAYYTGPTPLPCIPIKAGTKVSVSITIASGATNCYVNYSLYPILN